MSSVQTLTIVKTDIRGFTSRSAQMTSSDLDTFLHAHRDAVARVMRESGGTIVKEMGDSFLVTFASSTSALSACIELQRELAQARSPGLETARVEVRITVSAGDVLVQGGDIFGTPVNLAARLESITPPGEIYFTEAVYQNMNRNEIASEPVGRFNFKGIDDAVTVYRTTIRHQTRSLRAAVLFTDIANFTVFAETAPMGEVERVLQYWEDAHRVAAEANGGVVQHVLGDAQLLTFHSVTSALEAWLAVHARMRTVNEESDFNFKVQFSSGMDVGEVRVFRSALFGRACTHASHLSGICPKGAILTREALTLELPTDLTSRLHVETLDPESVSERVRKRELGPLCVLSIRNEV